MNDPKTTHAEIVSTFGQIAARGVEDALLESFDRTLEDVGPVRLEIVEQYVQATRRSDDEVVAVLPLYLAKTRAFWLMSEIEA